SSFFHPCRSAHPARRRVQIVCPSEQPLIAETLERFFGNSTTDSLANVRSRSIVTRPHHETEEDRDTQDRAGRPSAIATRRPAQTTSREDRAAGRNELRRANRVSP